MFNNSESSHPNVEHITSTLMNTNDDETDGHLAALFWAGRIHDENG